MEFSLKTQYCAIGFHNIYPTRTPLPFKHLQIVLCRDDFHIAKNRHGNAAGETRGGLSFASRKILPRELDRVPTPLHALTLMNEHKWILMACVYLCPWQMGLSVSVRVARKRGGEEEEEKKKTTPSCLHFFAQIRLQSILQHQTKQQQPGCPGWLTWVLELIGCKFHSLLTHILMTPAQQLISISFYIHINAECIFKPGRCSVFLSVEALSLPSGG